jgi:RNA polymerase sigma-70 factor (ECF subfamily)
MSAAELARSSEIECLYSDHHGWLCGWLRKKLGCAHNAADLAHDTFVRVMAAHNPVALREPRAYLTTIAKGLVVDHWRRQRLEQAYLEAIAALPESQVPSPEFRLLILETLARIDAMLDGLQPKARAAFLLSRLEGLGHSEIARQLGVSVSSVEKYMIAAMRHCIAVRAAG